jgi:hypothetical protein
MIKLLLAPIGFVFALCREDNGAAAFDQKP